MTAGLQKSFAFPVHHVMLCSPSPVPLQTVKQSQYTPQALPELGLSE